MADVNLTDNRQAELRITTIAITALALVFVGLRFASRQMKGMGIGIDDHVILVATAFLLLVLATCLIGIEYGLGMHMAALSNPEVVSYAKSLIAFECLYVTCICFTKLSLLMMYLRIFPVRNIRIGAYVLGGTSIAWCISIIMVSILQCTPMEKIWNPTIPGFCINLKKSFVGNAVPNVLTDIAILALPMHQVWRLYTSVLQKVQISFIFLLGSFVVFTSIYRFTTLFQFEPSDITWTLATAQVWCVIESAAGIISACLPTLGHLVQIVSRKICMISGLTWSSRAHTPAAGIQLQTFGGSNAPKKGSNIDKKTFDDSKDRGADTDSRPFRRMSTVSSISDEQEAWETNAKMEANMRAHGLESAESAETDEITLHADELPVNRSASRTILVKTELAWTESGSDMTQKNHREGDLF